MTQADPVFAGLTPIEQLADELADSVDDAALHGDLAFLLSCSMRPQFSNPWEVAAIFAMPSGSYDQ